jgi:peptide/nickel transport system substrate-binding protein
VKNERIEKFRGRIRLHARRLAGVFALALALQSSFAANPTAPNEELLTTSGEIGHAGGHLVVSLRSEPKTLNPVTSIDVSSREVISQLTADLIHIDRVSQEVVPSLAKSWKASADGKRFTMHLRRGIRFSDGVAFDADDVIFTFKAYLDEKSNSPQHDLLTVGGKPIRVTKDGPYSVTFELSEPYASAERLFDSVAILPRHLLEKPYQDGKLAQSWTLNTPPDQIAGLGPFRVKQYVPGQHLILERNPYYWKNDRQGNRLPYLNDLSYLFVSNEDAEVLRFEAGETDVLNRMGADNYGVLEHEGNRAFQLQDLGPSLEYNFLLFNLNSQIPKQASELSRKQTWFRDTAFRQAISAALDRDAMAHIIYHGRATSLATHVSPGNRLWFDTNIPQPKRSVEHAREFLKNAGFSWRRDGTLLDHSGAAVEFSILSSASNAQRTQMATMIQQDLQDIGVRVQVVPLEFHAVLDRVFQNHDYEAAVMALGTGDVDPNAQMNVWLSSGDDHLWNLGAKQPATPWEAEIDRLMTEQVSTIQFAQRKKLYDRVQEIEAQQLPIICLVTPHLLVGAKVGIGNFKPVLLDPHTLWNSEEMFLLGDQRQAKR